MTAREDYAYKIISPKGTNQWKAKVIAPNDVETWGDYRDTPDAALEHALSNLMAVQPADPVTKPDPPRESLATADPNAPISDDLAAARAAADHVLSVDPNATMSDEEPIAGE